MSHDWITLHRLDFERALGKEAVLGPDLPGAEITRTCVRHSVDEIGDLVLENRTWGILGVYPDEASARAVYEAPRKAIPSLAMAVTAWHGLAIPIAHRGTVNWRGTPQSDSALRCGPAAGPLVVVTSAGYAAKPMVTRRRRFSAGIEEVVGFYGELSGNIGRAAFTGSAIDGRDGITMSFWTDTAAMIEAAYKSGAHRRQLDAHETKPMFDRSSFTRLALQASKGSWDGAEIAA